MLDLRREFHQAEQHPRLLLDLEIRHKIFSGETRVSVPAGTIPFWNWHSSYASPHSDISFIEINDAPSYPAAHRNRALWFSGGVESTYTKFKLEDSQIDLLKIEDFSVFEGRHRKVGQIHFICAAISAALGYQTAYMGMERNDLLVPRIGIGRRYVERSPLFLEAWNKYLGNERIESLCKFLTKEEILMEVLDNGLTITGTCDNCKDGRWCGNCFKCYEAYYTAKAINRDLGFKLSADAFQRYFSEYKTFVDSYFSDNYNNAQQYFARLQILYGLKFDPKTDCKIAI